MRFGWVLCIMACTEEPAADDSGTQPVGLPDYAEPGPWLAGTRTITGSGSDGEPLTYQLWYPTEEDGPAVIYDGLLEGNAVVNAPVAACDGARPVMVFSHGNAGVRYQSPFFTEHLATHGYLVVAPDHRGNTFLDSLGVEFAELLERRPVDVSDAYEALLADGELAGCDDGAGFAVSGHSFGGYTALVTGGAEIEVAGGPTHVSDDRAWAIVALAPWDALSITDGASDIDLPTLFLTGERDVTTPLTQVRALYDPMTVEPRFLGMFKDGGHYTFAPFGCVLVVGDGCGEDFIGEAKASSLTNQATMAFLEDVRGVEGAIDQLPLDAPQLNWENQR